MTTGRTPSVRLLRQVWCRRPGTAAVVVPGPHHLATASTTRASPPGNYSISRPPSRHGPVPPPVPRRRRPTPTAARRSRVRASTLRRRRASTMTRRWTTTGAAGGPAAPVDRPCSAWPRSNRRWSHRRRRRPRAGHGARRSPRTALRLPTKSPAPRTPARRPRNNFYRRHRRPPRASALFRRSRRPCWSVYSRTCYRSCPVAPWWKNPSSVR